MANPTTNFGWVMPTSTDLVTDLPADFAIFGQAVDTSMAELKGGTTGQVLSKTSNTDMDFTWVTSDDANAIQNTIVDAKGDLIAASGADTPARLAVGNNGETLVADSAATTGLRYSATPSASNPVLNSAMQLWQRGTSISIAASVAGYSADRWYLQNGANQAMTISQQATGDTTNLPFIQYCARVQRNSGQTGTTQINFGQSLETINSRPFAGKTVTISFYARAGANYSPTSSALSCGISTGTGTDQNYPSYTGFVSTASGTATLTTTWQRFSFSGAIGATVTEIAPVFSCTPTGTASTNDYYEVTGVQIDIGSVALPFRTYAATIQGELAAAQRYYARYAETTNNMLCTTANYSTTVAYGSLPFIVQMRVAPTIAFSAGNSYQVYANGAGTTTTAMAGAEISTKIARIQATVASGLTAGHGSFIQMNAASGYLEASAEL